MNEYQKVVVSIFLLSASMTIASLCLVGVIVPDCTFCLYLISNGLLLGGLLITKF